MNKTTSTINPSELITHIESEIQKSPFSKQGHNVNLGLRKDEFLDHLLSYVCVFPEKVESNVKSILEYGTPTFQRNNDKWTQEMQVSYVENVLKGCPSKIQLFCLQDDYDKYSYAGCKIIDGLQRTTALSMFFDDKLPVFGGYVYSQLFEHYPKMFRRSGLHMQVEILNFDNLYDAIQFYIDINNNITHSAEDIEKAKQFLILSKEFDAKKVTSLWSQQEKEWYLEERTREKETQQKAKTKADKAAFTKSTKKMIKP